MIRPLCPNRILIRSTLNDQRVIKESGMSSAKSFAFLGFIGLVVSRILQKQPRLTNVCEVTHNGTYLRNMVLPFGQRKRRFKQLLALASLLWFVYCVPSPLFDRPLAPVLFDRHGDLLAARIAADGQWRFSAPDSLPERFISALIEFEDRSFCKHPGVHLPSLARATHQNMKAKRVVSGGSTLTMQVIRLSRGNPTRSIFEKFTELFRAIKLEMQISKSEVLQLYCTHAPMGGNVVGVEAASWRYFNRSSHQLSWAEAAMLAVLPNAPGMIFPGRNREKLKAKRDRLLYRLYEKGHFDLLTLELSLAETLPPPPEPLPQLAMHLLQRFENSPTALHKYRSTVDKRLQSKVEALVNEHSERLQSNLVFNAAALIADAQTGEVLAYVGNSQSGENASHVDIIQSPRSPGSSLKPLLYAAMLDEALLTPDGIVSDVPVHLGGFTPKNFSEEYNGVVPASSALARSLNIPAVLQLRKYGVSAFHGKLLKLGFNQLNKPSRHYGLSLILGGGETTLWELSQAWFSMTQTLSDFRQSNGRYRLVSAPLRADADTHTTRANWQPTPTHFSAGAVYATMKALEEVRRPDDVSGWEQMGGSRRIAWKTGTSYGYRDAWAIGATPEYIVAVWIGNADGTGRPGVIGSRAAAPLMFSLFDALPPTTAFLPPYDDLVEEEICILSGHRAGRYCDHIVMRYIPINSILSDHCSYHRQVFLDPEKTFRVTLECFPDAQAEAFFVLPPTEAWFYKQRNPSYRNLPPMKAGCDADEQRGSVAILHPAEGSKLIPTREFDANLQPLVFEAASLLQNQTLHWHLNEKYLGTTRHVHQIEVQINVGGAYRLLVMNDDGESAVSEFTIHAPTRGEAQTK